MRKIRDRCHIETNDADLPYREEEEARRQMLSEALNMEDVLRSNSSVISTINSLPGQREGTFIGNMKTLNSISRICSNCLPISNWGVFSEIRDLLNLPSRFDCYRHITSPDFGHPHRLEFCLLGTGGGGSWVKQIVVYNFFILFLKNCMAFRISSPSLTKYGHFTYHIR